LVGKSSFWLMVLPSSFDQFILHSSSASVFSMKSGPVKLFFLLLLMGIPGTLYYCPGCFEEPMLAVMSVLHAGLFWSLLWVGNSLLNEYLDRKINWVEYPCWQFFSTATGFIFCTWAEALRSSGGRKL
jgi:hypothetical protein